MDGGIINQGSSDKLQRKWLMSQLKQIFLNSIEMSWSRELSAGGNSPA